MTNYTHQDIADKYGSHIDAAKAYLSGEMTDEEERQTVYCKFSPMTVVQASHQLVMKKLGEVLFYLYTGR
jgi:hypothetical protein